MSRRWSLALVGIAVLVPLAFFAGCGGRGPGSFAWARRAGGADYDMGLCVAALSDGSLAVAGVFSGTATFGPGEPNETSLTSAGDFDVFIARYDCRGTLAWARRAGSPYDDIGGGVAAFSDDSVLLVGWFCTTATFAPGEPNETTLTSAGGGDVFVARYGPDGTLAWVKRAGGASFDGGAGVSVLSDDSAAVTGCFYGTATFGQGESKETTLTSAGSDDVFVARYEADGTLAWAKSAGGTGYDSAYAAAALSDDSAVVTGLFEGTATFGPGTTLTSGGDDMFVARWSHDGTLEWARPVRDVSPICGSDVAVLTDDSFVVTGSFDYDATFGPGDPNETALTSAGGQDMFLARYNPDGTLVWAKRAGGPDGDYGLGVAALADDSAVVTGMFDGTATFGPGEPVETILTSGGWDDIFIARYNPDGTVAWAKRAGGPDGEMPSGIAALADGSVAITGRIYGATTFGQGESRETTLTSAGLTDIFIARYYTGLEPATPFGGGCSPQAGRRGPAHRGAR